MRHGDEIDKPGGGLFGRRTSVRATAAGGESSTMAEPAEGWEAWFRRALPLLLILAVALLALALDLHRYLGFGTLREHRAALLELVEVHPLAAPLLYALAYVAVVVFSLPGGAIMTLAGGFLFGTLLGGSIAVAAATIGATILFLVAKTSLGDHLLARAGPSLRRMQEGFRRDALSYLFVLRLIPVFPFFLVNLAPAFLGVSLRTYFVATLFGIMPGTFVYALAGDGVGSVLDRGGSFSLQSVLTPEMVAALVGLALLALLPVVYRRFVRPRLRGGAP